MTEKEFARRVLNGKKDVLGQFLELLKKRRFGYCVIGGLAVNAYAEPVVSLDLDVVIESGRVEDLRKSLPAGFKVEEFPNSVNISIPGSDLRIQIQTDPRYQAFLPNAKVKKILGYEMPVARVEDVLRGKIWAALDERRRPSKRQKDLADILRLLERRKGLSKLVPPELKRRFSI